MKSLSNKNTSEFTAIIGCGRLGARIAGSISEAGGNVLVMDVNKEAFRKLPAYFGGFAVEGNGTSFQDLRQAEIQKADVLLVVTDNDNVNIMIAQMAKKVFHIPKVIARLYNQERECVYKEFGIETICPSELSAQEIDNILAGPKTVSKEEA